MEGREGRKVRGNEGKIIFDFSKFVVHTQSVDEVLT